MSYKVKLIPINQLSLGLSGPIIPLCQNCINRDCPLPIETVQISIFGVNKPMRIHSSYRRQSYVIECDGFMSDKGPAEEKYELRAISEIQERGKGREAENDKAS